MGFILYTSLIFENQGHGHLYLDTVKVQMFIVVNTPDNLVSLAEMHPIIYTSFFLNIQDHYDLDHKPCDLKTLLTWKYMWWSTIWWRLTPLTKRDFILYQSIVFNIQCHGDLGLWCFSPKGLSFNKQRDLKFCDRQTHARTRICPRLYRFGGGGVINNIFLIMRNNKWHLMNRD